MMQIVCVKGPEHLRSLQAQEKTVLYLANHLNLVGSAG